MRWKKIDLTSPDGRPVLLEDEDECYYVQDYLVGSGYEHRGNDLVLNLKILPTETHRLRYKSRAAATFASYLDVIPSREGIALTFIPTSKRRDDPAFDDRWEFVSRAVKTSRPDLRILDLFERTVSSDSLHGGAQRNIQALAKTLTLNPIPEVVTDVVLIDDVITSGASFKCCQTIIRETYPHLRIVGLFLAKSTWTS